LFTENTDSQTISEFCIAQDGTLSSCSTFNFEFFSMAFVQNGSIGIVTNTTGLSSYRMNATGPPSLIGTLAGLGSSVVVDPSERFVYSVDESTSTISEYSISSSGALAPLAAPNTVATGWLPFAIAVSPRGFLYSVDYGAGTITEYAINSSTGALTKVDTFPTGQTIGLITSQPRWISFDPTGSFAYVGNVYDNTISQFTVDAPTGALTQNGADVSTTWAPLQVVVDPSGKFAFSADGDGKILEFTINTDGTLAPNGTLSLGGIYEGFPFGIMFARR
jgi:6-phosphogluconolactonase (cycloisomerase 2 family)